MDSTAHPIRLLLEKHQIQSTYAADACGMSPSCFSSKLSGKLRWLAFEGTAILTFLREFETGLQIQHLFPVDGAGQTTERIQKLARDAKARRAAKKMKRTQQRNNAGA